MELPGTVPPDRDSYNSCQQSSTNLNTTSLSSGPHSSVSTSPSVIISSVASGSNTSNTASSQQPFERLSRPMSFDKMELLVREMQDPEVGVPVRSQKLFLTSIPSAFMGYDLIEWMMERLTIEESEALSIANQLCLHGYFFPVNDCKSLLVKDDSSLYRFQTPYYWPWQHKAPDNVEYAIYLAKRSLRNKQRHGLEDYESEALASLHKNLKGKWDFITMQAEEQVKLAKDRKKGDKIVGDSQERAYWRVHRPPPGQFTPLEPCPIPSRDRQGKPRRRTVEDWQREVDYLKSSMGRTRMKMSQACECLIQYCETFSDYDFFIQPVLPSNPWVTEDITFWQLNNTIVDIPTEKRVKRWAISIEELVSDPTGLQEFTAYLKKEYSHENIRFWTAVNDLRRSAHSQIAKKVKDIYEEFLEPGAPCEINIDGKTMERVQQGLKSPTRFTFDAAAEHIYALLLKKDCYPRFVRSEHYKSLLATGIQPSHKKRFFGFGVPKKKSSTAPPIQALLSQVPGSSIAPSPGSLTRRRGSDRSLSGSAHELAVSGIKDGSTKVPHSHSQSNLSDIPYSVVIYRGDMPSCGGCGGSGLQLLPSAKEESANLISAACTTATVAGGVAAAVAVAATTTVDGRVRDASTSPLRYQTDPKAMVEPLETTAEIPGALCSVCPWDSPETAVESAAGVSVSVCPWESETELPTQRPADPTGSRTRNNSTIDSGSSSSDISDVSDRMRRSCGIRQNTLDSDLFGPKRLAPAGGEQRRASMTIAPRLSDLQFSVKQHSFGSTTSTCNVQSPTLAKRPDRPLSAAQLTLNLTKTTSFEDPREDYHQHHYQSFAPATGATGSITATIATTTITTITTLPSTISEELSEQCPTSINEQLVDVQTSNVIPKTLNVINEISEVSQPESASSVMNVSECDDSISVQSMSEQQLPPPPPPSSETSSVINLSIITVTDPLTAATPSPYGTTPTINVVCPVGEEDNAVIGKAMDVDDDKIERSMSAEEQWRQQPEQDTGKNYELQQLDVTAYDDKVIPQEELSPTTDEYQECCPPDDYQYDISAEGEILAPGCIAPAPTPAPSIAPLAEVEVDPPDDDLDTEDLAYGEMLVEDVQIDDSSVLSGLPALPSVGLPSAGITSAALLKSAGLKKETKRKRKKRDSETKDSPSGDAAMERTDAQAETDAENRNEVCPWEDDGASSTDEPFVKTYSTLGFL